jgi:hypothetical protein
MRTNSI